MDDQVRSGYRPALRARFGLACYSPRPNARIPLSQFTATVYRICVVRYCDHVLVQRHRTGHSHSFASGADPHFYLSTVGIVRDVTQQRLYDQELDRLRQIEADLAHISRVTTMGELTASLAHEVNQPIAAAMTDANNCLTWLNRDHPDAKKGAGSCFESC